MEYGQILDHQFNEIFNNKDPNYSALLQGFRINIINLLKYKGENTVREYLSKQSIDNLYILKNLFDIVIESKYRNSAYDPQYTLADAFSLSMILCNMLLEQHNDTSTELLKNNNSEYYISFNTNMQYKIVNNKFDFFTEKDMNLAVIMNFNSKYKIHILYARNSYKIQKHKEKVLKIVTQCQEQQQKEKYLPYSHSHIDSGDAASRMLLEKVAVYIHSISTNIYAEDIIDAEFLKYLEKQNHQNNIIELSFDELLEQGLLGTVGKAILCADMLGYLSKTNILHEGIIKKYEPHICSTAITHSFNYYRDLKTGKLWLIDARWQKVIELSSQDGVVEAMLLYNTNVINAMIETVNLWDLEVKSALLLNMQNVLQSVAKISLKQFAIIIGKVKPGPQLRIGFASETEEYNQLVRTLFDKEIDFEFGSIVKDPNYKLLIIIRPTTDVWQKIINLQNISTNVPSKVACDSKIDLKDSTPNCQINEKEQTKCCYMNFIRWLKCWFKK